MTTVKWTPGPWEYTRQVGISHGISVAGEDRGKPETFGTIAKAGSAANARLIAAAPELLKALEKADAWVAQYHDTPGHEAASKCMSGVIRAALAKARDEQ